MIGLSPTESCSARNWCAVRAGIIVAGAVFTIAGCGSHSTHDGTIETNTKNTATAALPARTTSAARTALRNSSTLGHPSNELTFAGSDDKGYKASVHVRFYGASPVTQLPTLPSGRDTLAACQTDPQRDAVVPVVFTVTNETPSFAAPVEVQFHYSGGLSDSNLTLAGDARFADGSSSCDDMRDGAYLYDSTWRSPLQSGESLSGEFFLVVRDYYSPALPGGDRAGLAVACIEPDVTFLRSDGALASGVVWTYGQPSGMSLGSTDNQSCGG
jgi:hypothetical protein